MKILGINIALLETSEVCSLSFIIVQKNSELPSKNSIWADTSFADDETDRKSTIGNIVYWNGYLIFSETLKSKTNALSTVEPEFISVAEALHSEIYLRNMNEETFKFNCTLSLFGDNQACIKWFENRFEYMEKEHVELSLHFIRNLFENEI